MHHQLEFFEIYRFEIITENRTQNFGHPVAVFQIKIGVDYGLAVGNVADMVREKIMLLLQFREFRIYKEADRRITVGGKINVVFNQKSYHVQEYPVELFSVAENIFSAVYREGHSVMLLQVHASEKIPRKNGSFFEFSEIKGSVNHVLNGSKKRFGIVWQKLIRVKRVIDKIPVISDIIRLAGSNFLYLVVKRVGEKRNVGKFSLKILIKIEKIRMNSGLSSQKFQVGKIIAEKIFDKNFKLLLIHVGSLVSLHTVYAIRTTRVALLRKQNGSKQKLLVGKETAKTISYLLFV